MNPVMTRICPTKNMLAVNTGRRTIEVLIRFGIL